MVLTISKMKKTYKVLSRHAGQTMIEYVVIAAMLILMFTLMAVLLYAFRQHSWRVLDLAASEYP
jgi:hypothetical protein